MYWLYFLVKFYETMHKIHHSKRKRVSLILARKMMSVSSAWKHIVL